MSTTNQQVELFVAVFDSETEAKDMLRDFQQAKKAGSIDLIDAAVIVRKADGKVKIEETADPGAKKWAGRGAIAGGLLGLIFPPSIIGTALVGGGAGAIWGKIRDKGIPDSELKSIGDAMDPGTSAIIAIAQDRVVDQLEQGLKGYERITRHALSAEAAVAVSATVEDLEDDEPDEK